MTKKTKTLKRQVRDILVAQKTIRNMERSGAYNHQFGRKYMNEMAAHILEKAKYVHPLFPYYLITSRIGNK